MTALHEHEITARYNDGLTARTEDAVVHFESGTLRILAVGDVRELAAWDASGVHLIGDQRDGQQVRLRCDERDDRLELLNPADLVLFEGRCPHLRRIAHGAEKGQWRAVAGWGVAAVTSIVLLIFVVIPQAAGPIAERIPDSWREQAGEKTRDQILTIYARLRDRDRDTLVCRPDHPGQAALERFARRVAGGVPVIITVVDTGIENALALPGGQVMILRGLVDRAEDGNIVAAVLAHEIGHVVNRHSLELLIERTGTAIILSLVLGDVTGGALIAGMGEALISGAYSRDAEREADTFAIDVMNASGYDVRPLAAFFERIGEKEAEEDGFELPAFLSTHPEPLERAQKVNEAATGTGQAFTPAEWAAIRAMCD